MNKIEKFADMMLDDCFISGGPYEGKTFLSVVLKGRKSFLGLIEAWADHSQECFDLFYEVEELFATGQTEKLANIFANYFMKATAENAVGKYIAAEARVSYPLGLKTLVKETVHKIFSQDHDMFIDDYEDDGEWLKRI